MWIFTVAGGKVTIDEVLGGLSSDSKPVAAWLMCHRCGQAEVAAASAGV